MSIGFQKLTKSGTTEGQQLEKLTKIEVSNYISGRQKFYHSFNHGKALEAVESRFIGSLSTSPFLNDGPYIGKLSVNGYYRNNSSVDRVVTVAKIFDASGSSYHQMVVCKGSVHTPFSFEFEGSFEYITTNALTVGDDCSFSVHFIGYRVVNNFFDLVSATGRTITFYNQNDVFVGSVLLEPNILARFSYTGDVSRMSVNGSNRVVNFYNNGFFISSKNLGTANSRHDIPIGTTQIFLIN